MSDFIQIDINDLIPHPDNPRKDLGDLSELTESIRVNGILQNLTVVKDGDKYVVIIGHRRLAAAKAAGLTELPCTVADMDERQQLCTMMEENMQRQDLTIPEQAYGFQYMLDLGETVSSIAKKTGFSEQTVKHRLEIAKLPEKTLHNALVNEDWQISIKDLIMLEKIKDIKKRSEILKTSYSRGSFLSSIKYEVREQERERIKAKWKPLLDLAGVKPAPKGVNSWSSDYETVKTIDLDNKKVPKTLQLKDYDKEEDLVMVEQYGYLYLMQKIDKKKEELSGWQIEQKRRQKVQKELRSKLGAALKEMRQLAIDLYNGKRELEGMEPLQELGYIQALWRLFQENKAYVSYNSTAVLSDKKNSWDVSSEEKDGFVEKLRTLPVSTQLVVYMSAEWDELTLNTMNYNLAYVPEKGETICRIFDVLNTLYGFTFSDDEFIRIIEGTHELYEEPEEEYEEA